MSLFTSTQISWNEPWFFLLRIRTAKGWLRWFGVGTAVFVVMFIATYFFGNGRFGLAEAASVSGLAGLVILLLMDRGNIQREVTVTKDSIIVNSASGNAWFETFKFERIEAIELKRPSEWQYNVGIMLIDHGQDDLFMVAVPHKVSMDTLANVLYRLDLAVSLADWEPPDGDTQVMDDLELDPQEAVGCIETESLDGVEPRLMSPVQIATTIIIAFGPLLLALIGAVAAGIFLYRNWDATPLLDKCLIGGGALIGLIVALQYVIRIGQFIGTAWGVRVSRVTMQRRAGSLFSGLEDDLMNVELYGPEKWTAIGLEDDYGFLQIDRSQRALRFEGNKNRWTIPFAALTKCRIEEGIMGGEGNENAERRYFVVLAAEQEDDDDWEYGLIYVRTEIGSDTHERRYDRARLLFTQIAEAVQ